MRRFDLLDEYTYVVAPKLSPARNRAPDHRSTDQLPPSAAPGGWSYGGWRYGAAGLGVILLIASVAL